MASFPWQPYCAVIDGVKSDRDTSTLKRRIRKMLFIFVRFLSTLNLVDSFIKTPQYKLTQKSVQRQPNCFMGIEK
jgi:hypothetical protein